MSSIEKADNVGINEASVDMVEQGKVEAINQNAPILTDEEREIEKRIVRKIDYRLLPITALIYLLCYIDRSNIGKTFLPAHSIDMFHR